MPRKFVEYVTFLDKAWNICVVLIYSIIFLGVVYTSNTGALNKMTNNIQGKYGKRHMEKFLLKDVKWKLVQSKKVKYKKRKINKVQKN